MGASRRDVLKASILLPTGRTFDAIEVAETAGFLALARMERMEIRILRRLGFGDPYEVK